MFFSLFKIILNQAKSSFKRKIRCICLFVETKPKLKELKILRELSWVKEYIGELDLWEKMLKETRKIEEKVKKEGLNKKIVQEYCARNKKLKSMVKNIDVEKWEKEIFGSSMLSKRKIAFHFDSSASSIIN